MCRGMVGQAGEGLLDTMLHQIITNRQPMQHGSCHVKLNSSVDSLCSHLQRLQHRLRVQQAAACQQTWQSRRAQAYEGLLGSWPGGHSLHHLSTPHAEVPVLARQRL